MPSSPNFNLIMIKLINFVRFNITVFFYVSFFFLNLDYGILFYAQTIFLCCSRIACVAGLNMWAPQKIRRRKNADSIFQYAHVGLSVCTHAFWFVAQVLLIQLSPHKNLTVDSCRILPEFTSNNGFWLFLQITFNFAL